MKLLVVTSLKEYQQAVAAIFEVAQIKVFSVTRTIGHKEGHNENLLDNWFASGEEQFDSIVLFSFTEETNAVAAVGLIKKYNETTASGFPVRAFILAVEQSGV
jgi:uncharacterized protein YhfF